MLGAFGGVSISQLSVVITIICIFRVGHLVVPPVTFFWYRLYRS